MTSAMKTLLLVEDDYESRVYLDVLLKKSYQLIFADSSEESWEKLAEHSIDLILMDISLRGSEDGLELTRKLKNHTSYHDIPVIAVTAHAFPQDRENCLAAGCNAYFSKPFDRSKLIEQIERLLNQLP
jgi:two-component system cell cycle response regulator DivK